MAAIAVHHTDMDEGAWDAGANVSNLREGESEAYYHKAFAWQDPEADPETKGAYKFPHHLVSADGEVGAANVKACQSGCGVLNGGMGGADIPDADRQGVWDHLAAHLRDADVEPPELNSVRATDREIRTFHMAELRVDGGAEADPVIVGRTAVYNAPSEDLGFIEDIEPGFFEDVLEDDTRALFNHDPNFVLGRRPAGTLQLRDSPEALEITIRPPKTDLINDLVLEPMRRGDIDQMSFQFSVKADGDVWRIENNKMYRTLKRGGCARLWDTSVVTFPAYAQTSAQVRSKLSELRSQIHSAGGQGIPAEGPVQERQVVETRKQLYRKNPTIQEES